MEGTPINETASQSRSERYLAWLIGPLLLYLIVAIPLGSATRERFNSDGVCYLHRAMLLSHGDFYNSISGYWSPGLSWSVVPLLWLGIDPLHAIHLTLLAWGALFVLAGQLFLRSILPQRSCWILAAGVSVALTAARLAMPVITPDVVLGALLLFYLCLAPKTGWAAGLVAGLAFLGKAYALPFFLVHFLMTVFLRRMGWRAMVTGYLAFALIAGSWIGVLSWKYGKFTFSTAATRNRFMQDVAPRDIRDRAPDVSRVPPGPFFTNMEVTDADAWPSWSPLDSRAHFGHQIHIAIEHLCMLVSDLWQFDHIGLFRLDHIGFAILACLLAPFTRRRDSIWLLLTGCIYAGGLLLVVYETRYALPILLPISLALCLKLCDQWEPRVLPFIVSICFACSAMMGVNAAIHALHPVLSDRQMARSISSAGLNGLFATNTNNRDRASCVAFFLKQKFIAMPQDLDARTLQGKLDADGVKFIYRWFDPGNAENPDWPEPQTRLLLADGNWLEKLSIDLHNHRRLDIYERIGATTQQDAADLSAGK